jgi:hypothetical protein
MAGKLIQVSTNTVSSAVSTVTITGINTDDVYLCAWSNVFCSADDDIGIRVTTSGTPDSDSEYDYASKDLKASGTFGNTTGRVNLDDWDFSAGVGTSGAKSDNWITRTATVDYLVVAGGGTGGSFRGGGGGAGGYRASGYGPSPTQGTALELSFGSYTVTVGGGGSGVQGINPTDSGAPKGNSGTNSSFSTITSCGGGSGGAQQTHAPSTPTCQMPGEPGGSGGGAARCSGASGGTGVSGQGNPGANGAAASGGYNLGGGGGGAGAAGSQGSPDGGGAPGSGGAGGVGLPNSILGPATFYAGGGGGGAENPVGDTPGAGGNGGGGAGGSGAAGSGVSGTVNTGGGGGGAQGTPSSVGTGGSGGSGIVVVRVPSEFALSGTPGPAFTGSTHPGGDKIGKFTASGTLTISQA